MINRIFIISILSLVSLIATAQNDNEIALLQSRADAYILSGQFDSAIVVLHKALQTASWDSDTLRKAELSFRLHDVSAATGQTNESLRYLLRSNQWYADCNNTEGLYTTFRALGFFYKESGLEHKSIDYFRQALGVSTLAGEQKELQAQMASSFFALAQYDSSAYYYKLLLPLSAGNERFLYLNRLVQIAYRQNDYEQALVYNLQVADEAGSTDDLDKLSMSANNLGYNYVLLENYPKAADEFKKSLLLDEQRKAPDTVRALTLTNLGVCLQNNSKDDEALLYLIEALAIREHQEQVYEVAELQNMIALTYLYDDDLYNARVYSEESMVNAQKSGDALMQKNCYATYSKILQEGYDYENALVYYQKYLKITDSLALHEGLALQKQSATEMDMLQTEKELKLSLAEEEMKDLALKQMELEAQQKEQELEILRKQQALQELETKQVQQALAIAKQQHEASLREQEILALEQDKALQEARLNQKELEEKEQQKTIELLESQKLQQQLVLDKQLAEKRRAMWIGGLFSLIFIIVLISLLYARKINRSLARKRREVQEKNADLQQKNEEILTQKEYLEQANIDILIKNNQLEQKSEEILNQKQVIEKKNKSITDSIQYAQRIQTAVMPPIVLLGSYLPEHFVLFMPRDIVSGDFYWIKEIDGRLFIAAADCTGHGVPGAFMSMLGVSSLNEITATPEQCSCSGIVLNFLRDKVKNALHQTGKEGESKDGMDIALCILDIENNTLQYSGANNPLLRIRNNEIEQYKADKMPIGIHRKDSESFTTQEIEVQQGDQIYLFSDGYPDQFGGSEGRKFLLKNFKELLLDIHQQPMKKQQEALGSAFANWLGNEHKQIDDVLVIGFTIN